MCHPLSPLGLSSRRNVNFLTVKKEVTYFGFMKELMSIVKFNIKFQEGDFITSNLLSLEVVVKFVVHWLFVNQMGVRNN